jgi:hypothetical protein
LRYIEGIIAAQLLFGSTVWIGVEFLEFFGAAAEDKGSDRYYGKKIFYMVCHVFCFMMLSDR